MGLIPKNKIDEIAQAIVNRITSIYGRSIEELVKSNNDLEMRLRKLEELHSEFITNQPIKG
jgi:hypothetical protein